LRRGFLPPGRRLPRSRELNSPTWSFAKAIARPVQMAAAARRGAGRAR
jgi:hypothetical protein